MHRREVSKFVKVLIACLIYFLAYIIISFVMTPRPIYNFVTEDMRIGEKYVLIYLIAKGPVFSDKEGAEVFRSRRCGNCFITNNKGFLPISEFDAVVVQSYEKSNADPSKLYIMETPRSCLERKLQDCEPKLTSVATGEHYNLCSLCQHLDECRQKHREKLKR